MKKKPAPRRPVKGTWRPPSLARLWTIQTQLQEEIKDLQTRVSRHHETIQEVAKKANDHGNEIYALQHPIAPDTANRVVNNQAAEAVAPESSMSIVRKRVCHINGHLIMSIQEMPMTPNTIIVAPPKRIEFCQHCGMTLEEIRAEK